MRKKIILIADDQESIRLVIKNILRNENNIQLIETDNADDALRLTNEIHPDLVLLDIDMPGNITGIQVCDAIKKNNELKFIKVIFVTGNISEKDVNKGFEVGGDDYIRKPFGNSELLARVKVHLRLKYEEEINEFKDHLLTDFTSFMSHELRTPLNGIVGFSNLLLDLNLPPEVKSDLKIILKSGHRIEDFTDKVLLLLKLKNIRDINIKEVDCFEECIRDEYILEYLAPSLLEKRIKIIKEFNINSLNANCYLMCKGILFLLEYLIENSEPESEIKIAAKNLDNSTLINVSTSKLKSKIKTSFVFDFLDNIDIMNHAQGGLGLPILKEIIELHKGTIITETYNTIGFKFVITLPK